MDCGMESSPYKAINKVFDQQSENLQDYRDNFCKVPVILLWAATLFWVVAILGRVTFSNAKLLPREERKPPAPTPSSIPSSAPVARELSGMQKLQRMLKGRASAWAQGVEGSLAMNAERFQELVFAPPRNFSALVLFYSDMERCESCEEAVGALDSIARAYMQAYTSEYEQFSGRGTLFMVKVRITGRYRQVLDLDLPTSYPSLFYFASSASSEFNEFVQMDRKLMLDDGGRFYFPKVVKWIQTIRPDIRFNVEKEGAQPVVNPANLVAGTVAGMFALFSIYYFGQFESFVKLLKEFNYAYFVAFIMVWLLSGQMFNLMRGTATMGSGGVTEISTFIFPGSRYQYGVESMIVMLIYAIMMYGMIELIRARELELGLSQEERLTFREGDDVNLLQQSNHEHAMMTPLSCFIFGYWALQLICQIKT